MQEVNIPTTPPEEKISYGDTSGVTSNTSDASQYVTNVNKGAVVINVTSASINEQELASIIQRKLEELAIKQKVRLGKAA